MDHSKKAVLLGATGLVGGQMLSLLLESDDYSEVTVLTRKRLLEHSKLKQAVLADFEAMESYSDAFAGAADVFCCLGTTIKKAGTRERFRKVDYDYPLLASELAKKAGAQRFILITAMGSKADSSIFYSRVKGELERDVRAHKHPSLSIIRPSLLLGKRAEFRFGERVSAWLSYPLSFFLRGSLLKYRPIEAQHVARVMYRIAQMYLPGVHVYENDQLHRMRS